MGWPKPPEPVVELKPDCSEPDCPAEGGGGKGCSECVGPLPPIDMEAVRLGNEGQALYLQQLGRAKRPDGWGLDHLNNADGYVWLPQQWRDRGTYLSSEYRNLWAVSYDPEQGTWFVSKDRVALATGWGAVPYKTERAAQQFVESQLDALSKSV